MTQLLLILGSIIILIIGISCFFINAIGGCIGISRALNERSVAERV